MFSMLFCQVFRLLFLDHFIMPFFLSTRRNIELSKSVREEIEMFNCWLLIILVTGYWFAYSAVHLRISSRQVSDSCADKLHALLRHNFCVYRYKT